MQEDVLVRYINDLNTRGLLLIFQIVKNLAEKLANKILSYNWVGRFVKRKKALLKSVYLTIIDYRRKVSDNSHYYEHFFTNVCLYFYYVMFSIPRYIRY